MGGASRHNGNMKAYLYLLPSICMTAPAAENATIVFNRFLDESIRIIESIQDAESADLYAAQLKTRGDFLMGLAMSNANKGVKIADNPELKQRMQEGIKRIKKANFYNSRIMMAAYDERKLATLPPPTDEEKASTRARILTAFAAHHNNLTRINDKQSAEAHCIDVTCTMRLLRFAHTATLVDAENDTEIQQQIQLMIQDMELLTKHLREQQYYDSYLIKNLFQ